MSFEITINKDKVLVIRCDQITNIEVKVNGEGMEDVVKFKYLRVRISVDGIWIKKLLTCNKYEGR